MHPSTRPRGAMWRPKPPPRPQNGASRRPQPMKSPALPSRNALPAPMGRVPPYTSPKVVRARDDDLQGGSAAMFFRPHPSRSRPGTGTRPTRTHPGAAPNRPQPARNWDASSRQTHRAHPGAASRPFRQTHRAHPGAASSRGTEPHHPEASPHPTGSHTSPKLAPNPASARVNLG